MNVLAWFAVVAAGLGGLVFVMLCVESEDDGTGLMFLIMAVAAAATALRWLSEALAL